MTVSNLTLNASEHLFGLGFSETLMLRNLAFDNNYHFCTMIGGSESIRDIQEARNLCVDAFEFPLVESIFSIDKIFLALEKVFSSNLDFLNNRKIYITLSTSDSLNILPFIQDLKIPNFLNNTEIIFIFDRRLLSKSIYKLLSDDFEVSDYERKINNTIFKHIHYVNSSCFSWGISGGVTKDSIERLQEFKLCPQYIKTGLFTIPMRYLTSISDQILHLQSTEARLLNLLGSSLEFKYTYLNARQQHITNYLVEYRL